MRPRRHLILFVRAPMLGSGKRRLAREIGDIAALRFERRMLARLLRRFGGDPRWRFWIAVTPDRARYCGRLWPRDIPVLAQGHGDLGVRMRRALASCPPGPAVLIGADIPALGPQHIVETFRLLDRHDLVLGPATDGGFWLVGVRRPSYLPPLFGAVRWSSAHALEDVLTNLPRRLSAGFAATLEDVDDGESYRRLAMGRGF